MQERISEQPLLELDIRLTEDEIMTILKADEKRESGSKKRIQTAVLLFMSGFLLIAFFGDGMKNISSLLLASACLAVVAVVWLVPLWHLRQKAKIIAEDGKRIQLRLYPDVIEFGLEAPAVFRLQECRPQLYKEVLLLEIGRELVCIPRRAADGEEFALLLQTFGIAHEPQ